MANQDRSRSEVLRRRVYPTTGTGVIKMGSLLIDDGSGNAITADGTADQVADKFLGIAIHAKPADRALPITVGVDVIAEMACSGLASAVKVGDPVEFDTNDPDGQSVIPGSSDPIGKATKPAAVGETSLTVHFVGIAVKAPPAAD